MIRCPKCDNDTRTSELVGAQGSVMLAGRLGSDPQPVIAQVCSACGFIELYAPMPIAEVRPAARAAEELAEPAAGPVPAPAL